MTELEMYRCKVCNKEFIRGKKGKARGTLRKNKNAKNCSMECSKIYSRIRSDTVAAVHSAVMKERAAIIKFIKRK